MNKDTYTLWVDDKIVDREPHTRDGFMELLELAQTYHEGGHNCSIFSSKDEDAVWDSKNALDCKHEEVVDAEVDYDYDYDNSYELGTFGDSSYL